MKTVVSVCGDPGGAEALAPVVQLLQSRADLSLVSYAYRQGVGVFRDHALPVTELAGGADIEGLLVAHDAECVLTATSCNGVDHEKRFVAAARQLGIPSVGLLDFWSGYSCRFTDETGAPVYAPDRIAVMDARAREEMIAAGVAPDRIVITGQPAFDSLSHDRRAWSAERRSTVRTALGAQSGDLLVVFVSQPLSVLYGKDDQDPRFLGYTEHEVAAAVADAVDAVRSATGAPIRLAVRCHPREDVAAFASYAGPFTRIAAADDGPTGRECVMAADLIVGMNSRLLVEACYLGAVVLSVQPGLRHRDMLPTNELGLSRLVSSRPEVAGAIRELLLDERVRRAVCIQLEAFAPDGGATRRVVAEVDAALSSRTASIQ